MVNKCYDSEGGVRLVRLPSTVYGQDGEAVEVLNTEYTAICNVLVKVMI